jgi:hypothetical protein
MTLTSHKNGDTRPGKPTKNDGRSWDFIMISWNFIVIQWDIHGIYPPVNVYIANWKDPPCY